MGDARSASVAATLGTSPQPAQDLPQCLAVRLKILPENPPSKAEIAYWEWLNNPMVDGTDIVLVHKPTNHVVLEFTI